MENNNGKITMKKIMNKIMGKTMKKTMKETMKETIIKTNNENSPFCRTAEKGDLKIVSI